MSYNKNSTYATKFPILGILGLTFITLKLTGHITWSWLWVLSPFWIPLILIGVGFLLIWWGSKR